MQTEHYKKDDPKTEKILAEMVLTGRDIAKQLGLDYDKVYFRVVHEMTVDAPPWAVVRIQALSR